MKAVVLWFTGLSGSGKTTIANIVHDKLRENGKKVLLIDGDVIRSTIHANLDFTPAGIKENNRLIALMCYNNLEKYDFILVPIISPFRSSRNSARSLLRSSFMEVYINSDLKTCIKRDVKGLYKKALNGLIDNFIGIAPEVPYEIPISPEISIDTTKEDPLASAEKVLKHISQFS